MDINQLKHFIALAQTLNFSEAARRCNITQPSMSHSIGEMEKQLGSTLFLRSKKNVSITDAGRVLLPSALQIVELAEQTAARIYQMEHGKTGSVSISALTTSNGPLSQCISAFSKRYQEISLDIKFTSERNAVLALNAAEFDFHFVEQEMVPAGDSFDRFVSCTDRLCVAFPAGHPLSEQPLDFSRLRGERYVAVSELEAPLLCSKIRAVCETRAYAPDIVCRHNRSEAVLLSVGAGAGISIVPESLARTCFTQNVRFVPIPGADALRTYVIAWHRDVGNPAAKLFLQMVREIFQ